MRQTQNAQKKDNRKSIFVIGLLLLLVAVIGFGGYTLSKYVTKKDASGSASVAKWGFTVSADAKNLLGQEYKYDGTNSTVNAGGDKVTVKSNTSAGNIVAPGTTGSMTFTIGGTAEVKAKIAVDMKVTSDVVLKYKTTAAPEETPVEYYPVKWTLKKTVGENTTTVVENRTLAQLKDDLATLNATVGAGEAYANAATYTIEWAWAFEVNDGTNELDTFLGKIANDADATDDTYTKQDGTSTAFSFTLDISVTQVKE